MQDVRFIICFSCYYMVETGSFSSAQMSVGFFFLVYPHMKMIIATTT